MSRLWFPVVLCLAALWLRVDGVGFGLDLDDPSRAIFHNDQDEESMVVAVRDRHLEGDMHPGVFLHWGSLGFHLFGFADRALLPLVGRLTGADVSAEALRGNPSALFLCHRWISALAGALTVLLVYRMGRREVSEAAGRVAAVFLAVAYLHTRTCHFGTLDALLTLFTALTFDRCLGVIREGGTKHYLWAGVWAGLACGTKYSGVVCCGLIALAHGVACVRGAERWLARASWSRLWASAAVVMVVFVAVSPHLFFAREDLREVLRSQVDLRRSRWTSPPPPTHSRRLPQRAPRLPSRSPSRLFQVRPERRRLRRAGVPRPSRWRTSFSPSYSCSRRSS